MRFISITKSINIRLDWANITGTVLKAGTPISLTGVVANTADAVGILSQDVSKSDAVVAVVTEGTIDLGEIAASYGELDDAAISAMHGITFIDDGEPVAPSSGGGSSILVITGNASGASTGATPAEVLAAAAAGTPIFIKWGNRVRPAVIEQAVGGGNYLYADFLSYDPEAGGLWWGRWSIALTGTALGRLYYGEGERIALGAVGAPSLDWASDGDVVTFYQGNVIWANPNGDWGGGEEEGM